MSNTVQFTINLDGNVYTSIEQLDKALGKFNVAYLSAAASFSVSLFAAKKRKEDKL